MKTSKIKIKWTDVFESRQPSDGLPADLQKVMKNGPIVQKDDSDVQNDTEEIRSQKSRPQRTLSFDM